MTVFKGISATVKKKEENKKKKREGERRGRGPPESYRVTVTSSQCELLSGSPLKSNDLSGQYYPHDKLENDELSRGTVSTVTHLGNKEPCLHSLAWFISFLSHPHQPRSDVHGPSSCPGQLQSIPARTRETRRLLSKMQVCGVLGAGGLHKWLLSVPHTQPEFGVIVSRGTELVPFL